MRALSGILAALALLLAVALPGAAQEPAVHAVLFYSPTCPHCHKVINEDLPPLRQKYGERLLVVGVDVTTQSGQALYQAMVAYFALPESRLGVPALVVGTDVMVGSLEIPERFPGLIERGLAAGGIDWPPVEEIRQALAAQGIQVQRPAPAPTRQNPLAPADTTLKAPAAAAAAAPTLAPPAASTPGDTQPAPAGGAPPASRPAPAGAGASAPASPATDSAGAAGAGGPASGGAQTPPDREAAAPSGIGALPPGGGIPAAEQPGPTALFLRDPVGNGIAVAVLVALLGTLLWSVTVLARPGARGPVFPGWLFPLLGAAGAVVAAYLSYVELTGATAVCGPVGDCNAVQQSQWARLFGVLPVGVVGLAGYVAMLAAWGVGTWGPGTLRSRAWTGLWAMALVGTAFSAWLTFLEPFVIGATCAWCITSALVMALMLVGATGRAAAPPPPS